VAHGGGRVGHSGRLAALVLRWSVGRDVLDFVAGQVTALIEYTDDGTDFLFGKLVADKQETIFALQVLPVIYAPGVGPLLSMHTDGPGGRAALIGYIDGSRCRTWAMPPRGVP
jgi:hypothetical protein